MIVGPGLAGPAQRWLVARSDPLAGWAVVGSHVRDVARLLAAAHARSDRDLAGTGVTYSADAAVDGAVTSCADQVAAENPGRPLYRLHDRTLRPRLQG